MRSAAPCGRRAGPSYLALSPDVHRQLVASMKLAVGNVGQHTMAPVVLAPMDIRRFVRKVIEREFPQLAVLSYQELSPAASIQPLERVKLTKPGFAPLWSSDERRAGAADALRGCTGYVIWLLCSAME